MPRFRHSLVLVAGLSAVAISAGALATATPEDDGVLTKVMVPMTGAAEVPGPGATSASGEVTFQLDWRAHKACYALTVRDLDEITAAHIHKAAKGAEGPPVVTFQPRGRTKKDWDGCADVDMETLKAIIANPADYYINVHTAAFPKGALRVQMDADGTADPFNG